MLSIEKLRENSLPQSFEKGEQLHAGGAVRSLVRAGKLYSGEVQGSFRYQLTIDLSQEPPYTACSCPFSSSGWCKHLVAAGIAIMNNEEISNEVEGDDLPKDFFEDVFSKADDQTKEGFLRQLFEQREDMQKAFRLFVEPPRVVSFKQVVDMRKRLSHKIDSLSDKDAELSLKLIENQDCTAQELVQQHQYYFRRLFEDLYQVIQKAAEEHNPLPALASLIGAVECIESMKERFSESWAKCHFVFLFEYKEELQKFIDDSLLPPGMYKSGIELIIDRWSFLRARNDHGAFSLLRFDAIMRSLAKGEIPARYLLFRLEAFAVELSQEVPELFVLTSRKANDEKAFKRYSERFWKEDAGVARRLLQDLKEKSEQDFIEKAKIAFGLLGNQIAAFLSKHIEEKQNPELYRGILRMRASEEASSTLYKQWRETANEEEKETFIREQSGKEAFYLQLLSLEKKYETIRDLSKDKSAKQLFDYLPPIMEEYPDYCFEIIRKTLEDMLNTASDRSVYRMAADLLSLARQIPGYLEKVNGLHRKYVKLDWPALSEEINKPGLGG